MLDVVLAQDAEDKMDRNEKKPGNTRRNWSKKRNHRTNPISTTQMDRAQSQRGKYAKDGTGR